MLEDLGPAYRFAGRVFLFHETRSRLRSGPPCLGRECRDSTEVDCAPSHESPSLTLELAKPEFNDERGRVDGFDPSGAAISCWEFAAILYAGHELPSSSRHSRDDTPPC
ncbi:hypothetical protein HPB50_020966 [Hyalomma asiaticum]|uniref:Uncharacterized protein n=1 Tax=Hyalomma asiaticum TaxID=266040 RepID=A0ACB7T870_HYAAI|nr:hypothetical protein HPB50_020966 [Hyalomma asiaticum]